VVLAEPAQRAVANTSDDSIEELRGRWREALKVNSPLGVFGEDAVSNDRVIVNVQIQTTAKSL
jgi:hypothetical protein